MTNTLEAHTRTHAHSVYLWAAHYALLFALFEAVKAHRDAQWSGYGATAALGAVLTAVLYFLVVAWGAALIGRGFDAVLSALRRGTPRVRFASDALAAALMAAGVWAGLSVHREFWPTAEDAGVLAAIAALPVLGGLATRLGCRARARFHASVAIVLGGVLLALVVAGDALLLAVQRAELVVVTAGLALALGAVWMAATWTWRHAAGWAAMGLGLMLLWGLPLGVAVALRSAPAPADDAPPNVLFVVADTLRASALQLHGGPQPAPALEALAAQGVRFDQAQAPAPWTLPSMSALLASQPPQGLTPGGTMASWREDLWYYGVSPAAPTLAEVLQAEGYATGAVCANQLLKVLPGARRGLETWADVHPILLRQTGLWRAVPFFGAVVRHWLPALDGVRPADTTAALTRYAEAYIRRHRDRPFYLWVHYMDPHAPYDPPPAMRGGVRGPWPFFYPYEGGERWGVPQVDAGLPMPDADDRAYTAALYHGEAPYVDGHLGRLLDALEASGVRERTLVVFTSDHGEELWERGAWGHGQTLHSELLHVPWVIAGPGVAPAEVAVPVSGIDLVPTVAGFLGLAPHAAWRGADHSAALRAGEAVAAQPVFAQGTNERAWPHVWRSVQADGWKLITDAAGARVQLYDVRTDPGETNNLAQREPERVAALRALLDVWLSGFTPNVGGAAGTANQEMLETLESMGYL